MSNKINVQDLGSKISAELDNTRGTQFPIFSGRKDKNALAFVRKFKRCIEGLPWSDFQKIRKFASSLRGSAENWYYVEIELSTPTTDSTPSASTSTATIVTTTTSVSTFPELVTKFEKFYAPGGLQHHLLVELGSLRLDENEFLQEYTARVLALCKDFDRFMTDDQKINYLLSGLPEEYASDLFILKPTKIEEFYEYSKRVEISVDMKRKLNREKRRAEKRVNNVTSDPKYESANIQNEMCEKMDKLFEMCKPLKTPNKSVNNTNQTFSKGGNFSKNTKNQKQFNKNFFKDKNARQNRFQPRCAFCEGTDHFTSYCIMNPHRDTICNYCHKKGHCEEECRKKAREQNGTTPKRAYSLTSSLEPIESCSQGQNGLHFVSALLNNENYDCLIDGGADLSLMDFEIEPVVTS